MDALRGPFYCGMSFQCAVPSFSMRLNSPTSTSRTIAVAIKFSGDDGAVFTFDNPDDRKRYCHLRGFNCSYLSRFKEEDEALFFGGFYPIKVVTLRLIKGNLNLKAFIAALHYFDLVLNGSDMSFAQHK